jgi:phage terminase large subunit-like protein
MNADDKYQHADRERRQLNRNIEHIDFHIEYALFKLCAILMCPNVPMWCKNVWC